MNMNSGKRRLEDYFTSLDTIDAVPPGVRKRSRFELAGHGDTNVVTKDLAQSSDKADLASLLDFSTLNTQEEISERFGAVAHELLSNTILSVVHNGICTDYDILEVEFYLQKLGCHEDPFTHGAVEQERSGQWYFHRTPRRDTSTTGLPITAGGSYRGGTRKGLDLSIGSPATTRSVGGFVTIRGGVLFRTVRSRADNRVICGPSLLVDEILRLNEAPTIDHLVRTSWESDISALSPPALARSAFMYLQRATVSDRPTIYRSPRIGLDLSNPNTTESLTHPRVVFVGKPYRYFTHPELLSSKGRMQTFVGVYNMLRESRGYGEDSLEMKKALRDILRLGEQNVSKYMADYRSGMRAGKLKSFVGSAGKGVSQSASEYLKMMGTLRKALQSV